MRWLKYTVQLAAAFVFAVLCILPENGVNVPVIRVRPLVQNQLYAEKDAYILPAGTLLLPPDGADASGKEEQERTVCVYYKAEERKETMSEREYLIGVLAAEMPAYYNIEALKAQAVAARTYLYSKVEHGGCSRYQKCDICTYSGHCQGYLNLRQRRDRWGKSFDKNEEKLAAAVDATEGIFLTYNGEIISAMYHDSSYGSTEDFSSLYYGNKREYLSSVSTPEGMETVTKTVITDIEDFVQTVNTKYPSAGLTPQNIGQELRITAYTQSGRVKEVRMGRQTVSASEFQKLAGLRSTQFHFKITQYSIIFINSGYGHGVGMSQVGANTMAKNGSSYEEILTHYYTGVKLEK